MDTFSLATNCSLCSSSFKKLMTDVLERKSLTAVERSHTGPSLDGKRNIALLSLLCCTTFNINQSEDLIVTSFDTKFMIMIFFLFSSNEPC